MTTSNPRASVKASSFTESMIRDMTRLANQHGAINLGQGFPDLAAPEELKQAAARAIADDHNQYPISYSWSITPASCTWSVSSRHTSL